MDDLVARLQEADLGLDAHRGGDPLGEDADLVRRVRADVEHLAVRARVERGLGDDRRDVAGVGERPGLAAVPEDRHRLAAHDLVHEDADDVPIAVADVLALAVDVVRSEDDVRQAELGVAGPQVLLDGELGDAVRVLGRRHQRFVHRHLIRAVDGDRGREDEALDVVVDAGVDQVDAADQVVLVVEAPDEVAESFGGIGGQVVDAADAVLAKEPLDQRRVEDAALDERHVRRDVLGEPAAEVVQHHDALAAPDQRVHDV